MAAAQQSTSGPSRRICLLMVNFLRTNLRLPVPAATRRHHKAWGANPRNGCEPQEREGAGMAAAQQSTSGPSRRICLLKVNFLRTNLGLPVPAATRRHHKAWGANPRNGCEPQEREGAGMAAAHQSTSGPSRRICLLKFNFLRTNLRLPVPAATRRHHKAWGANPRNGCEPQERV